MTQKRRGNGKGLDRREFLISASGLAGSAVAASAWAARPCAPPSMSVAGGTATTSTCVAGTLPVLQLTSAATAGAYGWTFGQAFRMGDVPAGSYVTSNANSTQADVRNRWQDGSVKFAVVSGISNLSTGAATGVALATTGSAPAGAVVTEPTALDVAVTFTGDVSGTFTLQSCLGLDRSTWSRGSAGRIRQIHGPVMSEFHYYRPTNDAHVAIYFYVRKYANGAVEVETVVENGWIMVTAPGLKNYGVTLAVGGATRYTATLAHYHHTRWSRVDWIGVDPQIVPRHDVAYLRRSKLVPNYGFTSPSSAAFSGLASTINPAPFSLGNWSSVMGSTGAQDAIGLLPKWEALYCTSADARAYAATISNNRGSGRWPVHYRDENTGRAGLFQSYSTVCLVEGWGTPPPAATGGGPTWDIPHHPSNGYLAYLIEGRWAQLESLQFSADYAILNTNPDTRFGGGVLACINSPMTTRGAAWSWRSVGQAAAISPTLLNGASAPTADSAVQSAFAASIGNTATWAKLRYIDGSIDSGRHRNTIGWLGQYDGGDDGPTTIEWWGRAWMVQFQSLSLGHISDLGIENLAAPANLAAMRDHSYDNCMRLFGDDTTWNYRRAVLYNAPFLKNSSTPDAPVFMTTPEAFAAYRSFNALTALTAASGDALMAHTSNTVMSLGSTSNDGNGYWAVVLSVLAVAVEQGKTGAAAKRALVTAASNYDPGAHGANDDPTWAMVPRSG